MCSPMCVPVSSGRTVGFKENQYMLRQSMLTSDHLDTPLVRTGPPKSTDVVRWKITDNVHRSPNHPLAQVQPNPKETSECKMFQIPALPLVGVITRTSWFT